MKSINEVYESSDFYEISDFMAELATKLWLVDPDEFVWPLGNRQDICRFLGIRESTYSGWVKKKTLPRYASVAMGLALSFEVLKGRYSESQSAMQQHLPVKMGNGWGVVEIEKSEDGSLQGKLVAEGIPNSELAAQLSKGPLATRQLKELTMLYSNLYDGTNGGSPFNHFNDDLEGRQLLKEITDTVLKGDQDISEWQKEHG